MLEKDGEAAARDLESEAVIDLLFKSEIVRSQRPVDFSIEIMESFFERYMKGAKPPGKNGIWGEKMKDRV